MALTAPQKDKLFLVVLEGVANQSREAALRTLYDAFFLTTLQQKAILQGYIAASKAKRQQLITDDTAVVAGWNAEITTLDTINTNL